MQVIAKHNYESKTPIRVSLIVATLNRNKQLELLLNSLSKQSRLDFEVIVVDQGKPEEFEATLHQTNFPFPITHLHTAEKGASNARNLGVSIAQGDLLGFPDDDCEYPMNKIAWVVEQFTSDRLLVALTGIAYTASGEMSISRIPNRLLKRPCLITPSNVLLLSLEPTFFILSATMKQVKFDINMGVGSKTPWQSDEGPDLIYQILKLGGKVLFDPENKIIHPKPHDLDTYRALHYARGRGYIARKYIALLPSFSLYLFKAIIGAVLFCSPKKAICRARLRGYIEGYTRKCL